MAKIDILARVRDLLFPPKCVTCGEILPPFDGHAIFCSACHAAWDEARLASAEAAARAAVAGHAFAVGYRSGKTDGIPERFIFHLKHEGTPQAFAFAAMTLAVSVRVAVATAEPEAGIGDTLPPIYTYPPRRRAGIRADGFDQARRLARALAREMGGECRTLFRRRRIPEVEQKTLESEERRKQAARSYVLRASAAPCVKGRMIVLCDDLSTTGATLAACTDWLRQAGARGVVWATVGQTMEETGDAQRELTEKT